MPIEPNKKVLFIHVPKTAGTSIEKAMGVFGKPECFHGPVGGIGTSGLYKQHLPFSFFSSSEFDDYFSFTFTRHPYHRIVSEYLYLKGVIEDRFLKTPNGGHIPFKDFCLDFLEGRSKPPTHILTHLKPQVYFTKSNFRKLDFVGRFENLESDWKKLQKQFDFPDLGHYNRSIEKADRKDRQDCRRELLDEIKNSPKLKTAIFKFYVEDFLEFGYGYD